MRLIFLKDDLKANVFLTQRCYGYDFISVIFLRVVEGTENNLRLLALALRALRREPCLIICAGLLSVDCSEYFGVLIKKLDNYGKAGATFSTLMII
jgi:hypothetical protein